MCLLWRGILLLCFFVLPLLVSLALARSARRCALGLEGRGSLWIIARGLEEGSAWSKEDSAAAPRTHYQVLCSLCPHRVLPATLGGVGGGLGGCSQRVCLCSLWLVDTCVLPVVRRVPTFASLYLLPTLRRRVRSCAPCADVSMLNPFASSRVSAEAGVLPKGPFTDIYLSCFALCYHMVCLETAVTQPAVPSGQPACSSLAFQDLSLSLGSNRGYGHAWDFDQSQDESSLSLLCHMSRRGQAQAACQP